MSTLELKSHLHELIDTIQDDVALEDIEQFINLYMIDNQEDNSRKISNEGQKYAPLENEENNRKNDLTNNLLPMMLH